VVETTQKLEDILNIITSKLLSFKANLQIKNYRECVSSLFYASEAMTKYVLAEKGFYPVTHEGVQVLLAQHFVRAGEVKKEVYNYLTNLYMRRKDADYKGFVDFDLEDVKTYWNWTMVTFQELERFFEPTHKEAIISIITSLSL
jgi:uncharacterized protein (UPF0332 family)